MDQFEQGVWASRRLLKNYALKNIGHADDADDLVSQTMVNALANRKRFDGRNLEGWLMTILKNLIRDRFNKGYRKQKGGGPRLQRLTYTGELDYADHIVAPENPERAMILAEAWDALLDLPDAQADAVVLAGIGCTYQEMQEITGVAMGTVKSRVHRAHEALAGAL